MIRLSRRTLVRLVAGSACIFFAGLLLSCLFFQPVREHGWTALIISDVQSPEENPHGYGYSAAATALSGLLLLPVTANLHTRLWPRGRLATMAGTVALVTGAAGAITIGGLAPFPVSYDDVHIPLAFATFIGIVLGVSSYLGVLVFDPSPTAPRVAGVLRICLALQVALVVFLAYLYFAPDFFDGRTLWTTLAFLEWSLCAGILGMFALLLVAIES